MTLFPPGGARRTTAGPIAASPRLLALATILIAGAAAPALAAGDASAGRSLFNSQCSACHSLTANRVGPKLAGVYGRKAGTAPQFNYSPAVRGSTVVWNEETLDRWLSSPQAFIPGQRMNITVSDPKRRADIIAFLKSQ